MSLRWVESTAPVVDEECLVEALEELGCRDHRSAERVAISVGPRPIELHKRSGAWILRRTTEAVHQVRIPA